MATGIAFLEVDDVDHWLRSPNRATAFSAMGLIGARLFTDPAGSGRVAVYAEVPDLPAVQEFMASDTAAGFLKADGIRSYVLLEEVAIPS